MTRQFPVPYVFAKKGTHEITNLGHLAARNGEGLSDDHRDELEASFETKKDDPQMKLPQGMDRQKVKRDRKQGKHLRKIAKMTPEKRKTYIEKGIGL
jgi:hypothetical protein